jgi:hypothetical protein
MLVAGREPSEPWYVRQVDKPRRWLRRSSTPEELAGTDFLKDGTIVSMYVVASDLEEANVAAALLLRRQTSLSNPVALLRLPRVAAARLGFVAVTTRGNTGVSAVDDMHCNMEAGRDVYVQLATELRAALVQGEDRLRYVEDEALFTQFRRFSQLQSSEISPDALRMAERYLQTGTARA